MLKFLNVLVALIALFFVIEVKSSSRVKDVHLADLAIQSDVLQGCGIVLSAMCLMHINTDYIYEGSDIAIGRLFATEDVTDAVMSRRVNVPEQVAEMKTLCFSTHLR